MVDVTEKLDKCQETLYDIRYMCFEILAELKTLKRSLSLKNAGQPSGVNGQDEERKQ